jgi:hypothetical protein
VSFIRQASKPPSDQRASSSQALTPCLHGGHLRQMLPGAGCAACTHGSRVASCWQQLTSHWRYSPHDCCAVLQGRVSLRPLALVLVHA